MEILVKRIAFIKRTMNNNKFGTWLLLELESRGWSQSELARRAEVSKAAISQIISGKGRVGKDLAKSIAKALDLPEEQIFRKAGLLSPRKDVDEETEEIIHLYEQLDQNDQRRVLEFLKLLNRIFPPKKK